MSNRKYAALLEGGPLSEEQRMNQVVEALSEHINKLCQDIVNEDWYEQNEGLENGVQAVVRRKFKTMAPDLEEKYQIVVGTTDNDGVYKVVVGHRKKYGRPWVDNSDGIIGNFTINSDDIIRAINHSHDNTYIDATRITAGSINANTIQAGAITANTIRTRDWADTERWAMPVRDVQTIRVNERYGMGVVNTGGQATFTVEGTLR